MIGLRRAWKARLSTLEKNTIREVMARIDHDADIAERRRSNKYQEQKSADMRRKQAIHAQEELVRKDRIKLHQEKQYMLAWIPQIAAAFITIELDDKLVTNVDRQYEIMESSISFCAGLMSKWLEAEEVVDNTFENKWSEEAPDELGSA